MLACYRFFSFATFRLVVFLACSIATIVLVTEGLSSNIASAADSKRTSANGASAEYRWNLNEAETPLLSLPDRIGRDLDLSLTFSLGQFEFPLFQSLYYNQRAGKYILMVVERRQGSTRRAEFLEFIHTTNARNSTATRDSGLQLSETGDAKTLTVQDGSTYTFTAAADGDFHCRRIQDRFGNSINLEYTRDGAIQTISDKWGRTIVFSYGDNYISSITQTWELNSQRLAQTWVVGDEVHYAHRPAAMAAPASFVPAKRVPSNALRSSYTQTMADSDARLASIFGGPGAVAAANGFEPGKLGSQYPLYRGDLMSDDGRLLRGHLSFAMHLYGSADGTGETDIYVPAGFVSHSGGPSHTDAVVTFYYPRLGNLTDVTLAVFHVKDFQLTNVGDRVRIGHIGGRGGSIACYKHSHLEFYRGNVGLPSLRTRQALRIDPATVFGSTPGAK